MKHLVVASILLVSSSISSAVELTKYSVGTRAQNVDVDYEFRLDKAEVNTLASAETKAALLVFFTATLNVLGPVAAKYVSEKTDEVKTRSGAKGAWVKMTIRNGNSLHVWECGPLGGSAKTFVEVLEIQRLRGGVVGTRPKL